SARPTVASDSPQLGNEEASGVVSPALHDVLNPLRGRLPRGWTVLASLLIVAGLLVLADAGLTLVWQEPISALYARVKQDSLGGALRVLEHEKLAPPAQHALDRLHEQNRRISYLAVALQRRAKAGSAVGRIHIPTIGANFVVVKGTGAS